LTDTPTFPVDYDRLSFLYRMLLGEHLHHGYWNGGETTGQAQIQLMERLAQTAEIPRGASVLDIGCGVGGSALWLADRYGCHVTGMTISPVQASMATKAARKAKARGVEGSEHFPDKKHFFERCAVALKPGGTLAVCAWLRRDGPMPPAERQPVATIAEAHRRSHDEREPRQPK
jgi:tocopherol O-methyltransferase